jgi:hypothetical protein
LESLLGRGYFPKELPPTFTSASYGSFAALNPGQALPFDTSDRSRSSSKPELFHLARAGNLRRELSILNPIHYALLCECVANNWEVIEAVTSSDFSLSTPTPALKGRAIERKSTLESLPEKRASTRKIGRFLLRTDISRFYPSLYTHCIPWAFHTKSVAKIQRNRMLIGNNLDTLIRNCQDGQTIGIPVGPDASLVIAEAVLAQVDKDVQQQGSGGFRYMDDYELVFQSEQQALEARSLLQTSLLEFELHLNPQKTAVLPLPQPMQEPWIAELSTVKIANPNTPPWTRKTRACLKTS